MIKTTKKRLMIWRITKTGTLLKTTCKCFNHHLWSTNQKILKILFRRLLTTCLEDWMIAQINQEKHNKKKIILMMKMIHLDSLHSHHSWNHQRAQLSITLLSETSCPRSLNLVHTQNLKLRKKKISYKLLA